MVRAFDREVAGSNSGLLVRRSAFQEFRIEQVSWTSQATSGLTPYCSFHCIRQTCPLAPPRPSRMYKGAACVFPFSRGKGNFGRLSREDLPGKIYPRKIWKGAVFKPVSRDMWYFSEASRESKKKKGEGYNLYVHVQSSSKLFIPPEK